MTGQQTFIYIYPLSFVGGGWLSSFDCDIQSEYSCTMGIQRETSVTAIGNSWALGGFLIFPPFLTLLSNLTTSVTGQNFQPPLNNQLFACWVIFHVLTFFIFNFFKKKNFSGTLLECPTVWIQIRTDALSVLV